MQLNKQSNSSFYQNSKDNQNQSKQNVLNTIQKNYSKETKINNSQNWVQLTIEFVETTVKKVKNIKSVINAKLERLKKIQNYSFRLGMMNKISLKKFKESNERTSKKFDSLHNLRMAS
ncbi:hypothetical protein KO488_08350 [Poseidonibacter lekithochrous]|uniref:hypothetical protein n=1 Tax=Poseidonibacter TaxID=2321187 RepID=UPI001C098808|nr:MULTISPECIES: hypothetical protein [Poseidonibacter]MBU3014765.1 hypothetical protein [Poseidonibacter lekithochrous]MDO6828063.1 hypothetical protein [Poseidonibacter sp. 1_MG-2023]